MTDFRHIPPIPPSFASYPPRPGNRLTFLIDGQDFYVRLEVALAQATQSFWAVISFIADDFVFPSGRSFWELMNDAHHRGLDVRGLFWSNPRFPSPNVFHDSPKHREFLRKQGCDWLIRWDSSGADGSHCHHQKSWLIDVGQETETVFVGGMVLGRQTVDDSRHQGLPRSIHDSFAEIQGPGAVDVVHNFVQRWNEAAPEPDYHKNKPWPSKAIAANLAFPKRVPEQRGDTTLQITRTIKGGIYHDSSSSPGAASFPIKNGEDSLWRAYEQAFSNAQSTIYIESQHPGELQLLKALESALKRDVEVVFIVPGEPMNAIVHCKREAVSYRNQKSAPKTPKPAYFDTFEQLARLASYPNFTFAALALTIENEEQNTPSYREIYCHSKLAIVDGFWGHCGSANMVDISFHKDHSEINVQFWDSKVAMQLLRKLASEHSHQSFTDSHRQENILEILSIQARINSKKREQRLPLSGFIYQLDPRDYGLHTFPEFLDTSAAKRP
ncbi:MAG: phosphatidylserine/phosphatidylglycerophosphate/cardiolipin synthase family protein [Planctomycetota bacterium]|nr:phosphatidylserine/phosphatidylglycerophosphate/cardiolipin synthase family protein [Planctomycetota bacterium]